MPTDTETQYMQIAKTTVQHTTRGTVAIAQDFDGNIISVGLAILSPTDIPNNEVGAAIALGRCYTGLGIRLERHGNTLDDEAGE